jgi:hypothetical protein
MPNWAIALILGAVYVTQYGSKLLKRRLDLPDWSADEAYLTKLRAWRRSS